MAYAHRQRFSHGFASPFSTLTCVHRPCSVIREKPSDKGPEERKHRSLLFPLPRRIVTSPITGMLQAFQQRFLMRLHMLAALLALQERLTSMHPSRARHHAQLTLLCPAQ